MKVHQVFGLFSTEMPELFKDCSKKMVIYCENNDYEYKLWNKKMCDDLIELYPQYLEMYKSVRYPIMQVDIIRYLILHHEGGLYADMDIEPISLIKDFDWAVSVYHNKGRVMFNMEVLQAEKGQKICLDYLDYVKSQILEKNEIKVYETWKIRYVLQTSGPRSLTRFMKKNLIKKGGYKVNNSTTHPNRMNLEGDEDFISYPSGSWITK